MARTRWPRCVNSSPISYYSMSMMPKLDGISVVKQLKQDNQLRFIPVILVTAKADTRDVVAGLEAGGDDYLTKPVEQAALVARVRRCCASRNCTTRCRRRRLSCRSKRSSSRAGISYWKSASQISCQRSSESSRLQRFLAPQVAKMIASSDAPEAQLGSHRRDITVVFCDLRGFTAFTESTEPEEVMGVLREYHESLGELIFRYEGTLERFLGDGIMIIFNDPIPCADHTERAVRLALDMRTAVEGLAKEWRRKGHALGFGIGIASGYATLGQIGFEHRREYTAIGSVTNLASRLCGEAQPGQIVISQRTFSSVEGSVEAVPIGDLTLKGFNRPMPAYDVVRWRGQPPHFPTSTLALSGGLPLGQHNDKPRSLANPARGWPSDARRMKRH